ncbi:MAG: UDP-N-acetylglucosamine 1-carboxyvinyltransferase [Candidatus Margulisiibacteriota bacterium]
MRRIKIRGGNSLEGEVTVSGSKNSALPILAATILTSGTNTITNIPDLLDVKTMIRVLRALGVIAEYQEPNSVRVSVNHSVRRVAPYDLVTKMRASFFVIGPILAKMGLAKVPLPGGCAIGSRPVDIHIKGLKALGAEVTQEHGFIIMKADRLKGSRVYMDFPSVGATETIMMAATLAEGETLIENAAKEPEIVDLANYLIKAGARISGVGTEEIKIQGVSQLKAIEYRIIPDRIEAGTLMIASAITGGEVVVHGAVREHVDSTINKLREANSIVKIEGGSIRVKGGKTKAVNIKTLPYPGFPTDMQPQFTALLSLGQGTSVINETVFENRFMHVHELRRMGAEISLEGRTAIISGVKALEGAPVKSRDLRAGAALILAGLAAEGESLVEDIDGHIERGYEFLDKKLCALGANIEEVSNISAVYEEDNLK